MWFMSDYVLKKEKKEKVVILSVFHFTVNYTLFTEKAVAAHSSTLAWKIPCTEEPGGLQSMGFQRIRHD